MIFDQLIFDSKFVSFQHFKSVSIKIFIGENSCWSLILDFIYLWLSYSYHNIVYLWIRNLTEKIVPLCKLNNFRRDEVWELLNLNKCGCAMKAFCWFGLIKVEVARHMLLINLCAQAPGLWTSSYCFLFRYGSCLSKICF